MLILNMENELSHSQTMDFMDFLEEGASTKFHFTRPILLSNRQQTYNAEFHCVRALDEMHRLYKMEKLCDVIIFPNSSSPIHEVDELNEFVVNQPFILNRAGYSGEDNAIKRFKHNDEVSEQMEQRGIKCHRLMLAASSSYFERMFAGDMSESKSKEISVNSISYDTLLKLVEFCYTSKITLDRASVLDMFEASDMFQFIAVRSFCEDFLLDEIDAMNCLSFLLYSEAYSTNILYNKAFSVAIKQFVHIYKTDDFLNLPIIQVEKLLSHDGVVVEYEEDIFYAFKCWIMHNLPERLQYLLPLLKCVRLNFVSRWFLLEVVSRDDLVKSSEDCCLLVQLAKDQLLAVGHSYEVSLQLPLSRIGTGLTNKIIYINTHDPNPTESEVYLFDVFNKSWSKTSRPCPLASKLSTCTTVGDSLLVIGGWANKVPAQKSMNQSGALSVVHEFKVMSIFPTLWYIGSHNMGIHRYMHSTICHGNDLYLVGGFDEARNLQSGFFVTNAANSFKFEPLQPTVFNTARPALAIYNNTLFVFGGYGRDWKPLPYVQYISLTTLTEGGDCGGQRVWKVFGMGAEFSKYVCMFACVVSECIYCLCGVAKDQALSHWGEVDERHVQLKAVIKFCPDTFQMQLYAVLSQPRTGAVCMSVLNDKVYITGGERDRQPCNVIESYEMSTRTVEIVGNCKEGTGQLTLCTSMRVMHENFGL